MDIFLETSQPTGSVYCPPGMQDNATCSIKNSVVSHWFLQAADGTVMITSMCFEGPLHPSDNLPLYYLKVFVNNVNLKLAFCCSSNLLGLCLS